MPDAAKPNICGEVYETFAFSHYAYGNPLEHNAMYFGSDGTPTTQATAATIYVQCQREEGHPGVHLHGMERVKWSDDE